MSEVRFPPDFVWGAASAAYQIEGAWDADGKGESIWDRFSHTPGKIRHGHTGDVACDHYRRYPEDVALMRETGLRAYRCSIAWTRILPDGTGAVNQRGIDYYKRLFGALREAGVAPWVTLYHWDLPQKLQDRGGFLNRDVAEWFGEFAEVAGRAFGDEVQHWMTINEPQVLSSLGHMTGEHAPGLTGIESYITAAHHINLAHGAATQALRVHTKGKIGCVHQSPPIHPYTDSDADRAAAQRFDAVFNRIFLDPVLLGRYPADIDKLTAPGKLPVQEGDLTRIHQPLDFVGVNNYFRVFVRALPGFFGLEAAPSLEPNVPAKKTTMGWEIYPDGIYEVLMRMKNEYGDPELYVTENGGAFDDKLVDGEVHDDDRIELLRGYLGAVARAKDEGAKVRGYFVWSFTDNFEWAHGCAQKFGLVHVDYATQKRTLKDSAKWYRDVIQRGGFAR